MNNYEEIMMRAEDEYEKMKDRVHDQYDEIKYLKNVLNNIISYLMEVWKAYETKESIIFKLKLFGFNKEDIEKIMKGEGINE